MRERGGMAPSPHLISRLYFSTYFVKRQSVVTGKNGDRRNLAQVYFVHLRSGSRCLSFHSPSESTPTPAECRRAFGFPQSYKKSSLATANVLNLFCLWIAFSRGPFPQRQVASVTLNQSTWCGCARKRLTANKSFRFNKVSRSECECPGVPRGTTPSPFSPEDPC